LIMLPCSKAYCLVDRGEGPASRAVLRLAIVLVRLVLLVARFVRSVYSVIVCLEVGSCLYVLLELR
jgi:hypothetical protein